METPDLTSPDYWESESVDLRLNPKRPVEVSGLREFLVNDLGLRGVVVLATSGSGGSAKFVVLSKGAILASARAVNGHCGLGPDDVWLGGLSTFHVGGIGIYARAYASGASVVPMAWDAWTRDGSLFLDAVRNAQAKLTSLTPAHLWDLVRTGARCPATLRGVFLGGGRIDPPLVVGARELGWPVRATYGMSEAASQVATALDGQCEWLPLLSNWQTRTDAEGRLLLRGDALFSGYAQHDGGGWAFDPARDEEGWFVTGDRCELREGRLRFLERADGAVKVSGELISLSAMNDRLARFGIVGLVVAVPDERRGNELVMVCEEGGESLLERFNAELPQVERVVRHVVVTGLPRTEIGKLDRVRIESLAQLAVDSQPTG